MEHPVREIASVITTLTTGSPQQQQNALAEYFLPDASFSHPFCHVPSFNKGAIPLARNVDSLWVILCIYRWYRTLSPNVDITIDSAVFDQRTSLLYVTIHQTFAIWFIPFYKARVRLVTVLNLNQRTSRDAVDGREPPSAALAGPGHERSRYYIASQEDFYQMNDCVQFLVPRVGHLIWFVWQLVATGFCVLGALVFLPLYYFLNGNKTAKKLA